MTVSLKEITESNFRECIKLTVGDADQQFVASNLYSIAESKFDSNWITMGI